MQRRAGMDDQANDRGNETPKDIINNRLSPHLAKPSEQNAQNQSA